MIALTTPEPRNYGHLVTLPLRPKLSSAASVNTGIFEC